MVASPELRIFTKQPKPDKPPCPWNPGAPHVHPFCTFPERDKKFNTILKMVDSQTSKLNFLLGRRWLSFWAVSELSMASLITSAHVLQRYAFGLLGISWHSASCALVFRSVGNHQVLASLLSLGRHPIWNLISLHSLGTRQLSTSRGFSHSWTFNANFASLTLRNLHAHLILLTESNLAQPFVATLVKTNYWKLFFPAIGLERAYKNESTSFTPARLPSQMRT